MVIGHIVLRHVINNRHQHKGGYLMYDLELKEMQQMKIKIEQHEETITQLLEIIATTNRRVSNLYDYQFAGTEEAFLTSSFPRK